MSIRTCPHCGAQLAQDYQFCIMCGRPLSKGQQQASPMPGQNTIGQPIYQQPTMAQPASKPSYSYQAPQYLQQIPQARSGQTQVIDAPAPVFVTEPEAGKQVGRGVRLAPVSQVAPSVIPDAVSAAPRSSAFVPEPSDTPTTVFEDDDDSEDIDSATTILDLGPAAFLVRRSTGERLELEIPAVVGKGSAATVRVGGNTAISRAHLSVDVLGDEFVIEDLGSTNKTSLNDVRVTPGEKVVVQSGDVIRLADEEFDFVVDE